MISQISVMPTLGTRVAISRDGSVFACGGVYASLGGLGTTGKYYYSVCQKHCLRLGMLKIIILVLLFKVLCVYGVQGRHKRVQFGPGPSLPKIRHLAHHYHSPLPG